MRQPVRIAMVAVLAATGGALCPLFASAAPAAPATFIVDDNLKCTGSTFTSINAAVASANAGDTIQVCAGIYPENVTVDKPLTFLGAKSGNDGRKNRNKLAKESIVVNAGGDFTLGGNADNVTIDGFTLQGAGSDAAPADAIEAFQGSSGLTVMNNVIRDNLLGINFQNPNGALPAEISRNAFIDNSLGTSSQGGTAVFISNGPANNTTIENNRFTGHRETAVNFAGDGSRPSTGLVLADNTSNADATFVVAINSTGALIDGNTINYNGDDNGSAILDFGSNSYLHISHNTISGGDGEATTGIRVGAFTGVPSIATTVVSNTVTNRYNGIRVNGGYTDLFISDNTVSGSENVGISIEASSGNTLSRNTVSASVLHDCADDTTGSRTAGTANTWRHNTGASGNSTPLGICPA